MISLANQRGTYFSVAKLVALTYTPNPDNLKVVAHIDKNILNNHVSNLRWSTKSAQIKDDLYYHNKTHGQKPKKVKASTGEEESVINFVLKSDFS